MASGKEFNRSDEVGISQQLRPTTRFSTSLYNFLSSPRVAATIYAALAISLIVLPYLWPIAVLFGSTLYLTLLGQRHSLPFNAPYASNETDFNDPKIGRSGFNKAKGVFHIGNVIGTLEELYMTFSSLLRHIIVFGTTGAGKTETLVSFAANFIATGSGLIFNDAKAAPALAWQLYTVARFFGRDDDFLIINYLTGNTSASTDPAVRLSNDSAPFAFGSAEASAQLIIAMLPVSKGGENKIFSDSAIALIQAVMPALTNMRDRGDLLIDPSVIRKYMAYAQCCTLLTEPSVSAKSKTALRSFFESRAGFKDKVEFDKQPEEVRKQFGFAQAYFIRSLSALSDVYGHIYMTGAGEVDFRDIILNDRIMCTLLPSLQYSGDELSNLGKIILSSIRNSMAIGLGHQIEGTREDVLESLPTNSNKPFGIINDEYAYMAVEGFAITAAQGRGLNCAMITAGQDFAGWKRASETEAEQLVSNARLKYIMATEDVHSTLDLVKKLAGEAWLSLTEGYEDKDSLFGNYKDTRRTKHQKIDRITSDQLRALGQGEGYAIYEDKVELISNFWHGFTADDLVSEYKVGRRMIVDHRSKRGALAHALTRQMIEHREKVTIWINHLDEPIDTSILSCPTLLLKSIEVIQSTANTSFSALEHGLAFITALSDTPSIANQGNGQQSLLSAVSGTFDQQTEMEDEHLEEAVVEILDVLNNMAITPQSPVAQTLIGHPDVESDHLAENNDHPITSQTSLFTVTEEDVIARGVGRITEADGGTQKEAEDAGKETISSLRAMSQYPKPIVPIKYNETSEKLSSMIQDYIATAASKNGT